MDQAGPRPSISWTKQFRWIPDLVYVSVLKRYDFVKLGKIGKTDSYWVLGIGVNWNVTMLHPLDHSHTVLNKTKFMDY